MKNQEITKSNIFLSKSKTNSNQEETNMPELKKKLLAGEISLEEYNRLNNTSLYSQNTNSNTQYSTNFEKFETDYYQEEIKTAHHFKELLSNPKLLNDDILLEELKNIKNLNLTTILEEYRSISDGNGLLDSIEGNSNLKEATKKQFKETFTQILENDYVFDVDYQKNKDKVYFETRDFTYESDEYNIKQKNRDILEIENANTKEKKIIDFKKLVPEDVHGINDIIALKAAIQELPGEILFQIPDEVSFIIDTDILKMTSIIEDSESEEIDGVVTMLGKDKNIQLFVSNDSPTTIVHELSHAIFADKSGNDALLKNEKFMNSYKIATDKLKKDNLSYEKDGDAYYWSTRPQELGAEVLTAIMLSDYEKLETIEKYAPSISSTVIEIYESSKQQSKDQKHTPIDIDGFFNYLKTQ